MIVGTPKTGGAKVFVLLIFKFELVHLAGLVQVLLCPRPLPAARLCGGFRFSESLFVEMAAEAVVVGRDHLADHTGLIDMRNRNVCVSYLYTDCRDITPPVRHLADSLLHVRRTTLAPRREVVMLQSAIPKEE